MASKDPRVDAYIAKSPEFARPILKRLRRVVHAGCPDVFETIKWGSPAFEHKGILCGMAAFKQHCVFGFWKGALLVGKNGGRTEEAMGQFGRIMSPADLPSDRTLIGYVKKAVDLNERGVPNPSRTKARRNRPLAVPDDFMQAVRRNRKALATFEGFNPSHKREYVEWVTEAKTDATRERRLRTAVGWLAEGKVHNWRYVKK